MDKNDYANTNGAVHSSTRELPLTLSYMRRRAPR